jgi:VWFA-related protein
LQGDSIAGFKKVHRMTRPQLVLLGLLLYLPVPVFAQQPSAPPATTESKAAESGPAEQTAPQPTTSPSDPVLVPRPPSRAPKPLGAVTPDGRIHLDVLVSDAAGKPVLGLEPSDFKLLDNDQPRRILSFRSFDGVNVKPDPPVEVILLIDMVNLPFSQLAMAREEIAKFLSQNGGHLAQPVSIMVLTDAGLRVQPRPSVDGNALLTVLNQIKGGIASINPALGSEAALQRLQVSLRQMVAIAENESLKPGRKLLIWVGPGWPMLESRNFSFSDKDQRRYFDAIVELSTRIREARMVVNSVALSDSAQGAEQHTTYYQVYLKGVPTARQADTGDLALKVLAVQSGGLILGPDNDLALQINRCIADANAFYTISFDPPRAEHADEYHDLKVQVAQLGLIVRTSTGYYNQPQPPPVARN